MHPSIYRGDIDHDEQNGRAPPRRPKVEKTMFEHDGTSAACMLRG
ncbi:MAG: hypothetical protein ABL900_12805 [Burkholderiaceae bacterium]